MWVYYTVLFLFYEIDFDGLSWVSSSSSSSLNSFYLFLWLKHFKEKGLVNADGSKAYKWVVHLNGSTKSPAIVSSATLHDWYSHVTMPLYMRMTSSVTTLLLALAPFVPSSVLTCPFSFYIFNILLPLNFTKYILIFLTWSNHMLLLMIRLLGIVLIYNTLR